MGKIDENLFQIGEVAKILGVTRKTILVYEDKELLTPAFKDPESGFRYYTADNMTQIQSIRSLQALGLSLREVAGYFRDSKNLDLYLKRIMEIRESLDRSIQIIRARSTKQGDLTVHGATLPRQVCLCRQYQCKDATEAAIRLRETYISAARTGKMSIIHRMFVVRMAKNPDSLDLMCCIPMDDSFAGPDRMEFAETPALSIYYRGAYEGIETAMHALAKYAQEHNIQITGSFRSIYLEGPPNRGQNNVDYITLVALPVEGLTV